MFRFSTRSRNNLNTCHPDLQKVADEAINYYDFSVVFGHRGEEQQNEFFKNGTSKLRFPNSKHNKVPSLAFDLYPWHSKYGSLTEDPEVVDKIMRMTGCTKSRALAFIREEYCMQAAVVMLCAKQQGIVLRWGGDWNQDLDRLDQTFHDLAHFELV